MKRLDTHFKSIKHWTIAAASCVVCLLNTTQTNVVEAYEGLGGPPHIGTFEGSTTFTTSSSNGINPGLYLEVIDAEGNYTEYTSEEGIITIQGTKEGAYVTQAKLLGKTKYMDQDSGEVLDTWEEGRNLKLVSVENPGLITTGKNLFDKNSNILEGYNFNITEIQKNEGWFISDYIEVKPNTTYVMNEMRRVHVFDKNKKLIAYPKNEDGTFTTPYNGAYIRFNSKITDIDTWQLEEGSVATTYEPYQSSLLNASENIELRGIGNVQDELDLVTGQLTQCFYKTIIDKNYDWTLDGENNGYLQFGTSLSIKGNKSGELIGASNKFVYGTLSGEGTQEQVMVFEHDAWITQLRLMIDSSKLETSDLDGFKKYISNNPFELIYAQKPAIKTVAISSTYYFDPVLNREIRVKGTILPLVASVNIPTEPLSFIIDPNQAEDQQFIAPEFSITNQTPVPIDLNLKTFEQTTTILNDVLPETHLNWRQLNQKQSKDIALALVPQPSDGWLSLDEGPRYVADSSNYQLGEVKEESTVEFTFSALHGRAFVKELNPEYRLSFEFGFRSDD